MSTHLDRPTAIAGLLRQMRTSLVERSESVILGDTQLRYFIKGKRFEDGDGAFQVLSTGLFMSARVTRNGRELPACWLCLGQLDDLETVVTPHLDAMSTLDIEAMAVSIAGRQAMRSLIKARVLPDQAAAPAEPERLSPDGTVEATGEVKDPGRLPSQAIFRDQSGQLYIASGGRHNWLSGQPFTPGERPEFSHEVAVRFDLSDDCSNPERRQGPVFYCGQRYEGDWENVARYVPLSCPEDAAVAERPCRPTGT